MMVVGRDVERMRDYLAGQLSPDEHRAFEDRLLRDPGLVSELELSLRLREGLEVIKEQGHVRPAARGAPVKAWVPALLAAGVAGLALLLWAPRGPVPSTLLTASLAGHDAAGAEPAVAAHFTFVAVRGSSRPVLDVPVSGAIEFRAAPAADPSLSRYRLTLARENDAGSTMTVGSVDNLPLSKDGYVRAYADAARLAPGRYQLRVSSDPERADAVQSFPFTLRRADAPHP